jgi:orotidine-5'-phosphate decarboxylase
MTGMPPAAGSRIIVALDFPSAKEALRFCEQLEPGMCRVKVGFELFTVAGPILVEKLAEKGFDIFLDLKFHDIPNTVAQACTAAAGLGIWMLNVHALGGRKMMLAARDAVEKSSRRPLLIGVTILTSHSANDLGEVGLGGDLDSNVLRLARLTRDAGLDGVVCSAREAAGLRADLGSEFCLVTPGIRPAGADAGDQQRVVTPAMALQAGATFLVIGRPITQAADPVGVLMAIDRDLAAQPASVR